MQLFPLHSLKYTGDRPALAYVCCYIRVDWEMYIRTLHITIDIEPPGGRTVKQRLDADAVFKIVQDMSIDSDVVSEAISDQLGDPDFMPQFIKKFQTTDRLNIKLGHLLVAGNISQKLLDNEDFIKWFKDLELMRPIFQFYATKNLRGINQTLFNLIGEKNPFDVNFILADTDSFWDFFFRDSKEMETSDWKPKFYVSTDKNILIAYLRHRKDETTDIEVVYDTLKISFENLVFWEYVQALYLNNPPMMDGGRFKIGMKFVVSMHEMLFIKDNLDRSRYIFLSNYNAEYEDTKRFGTKKTIGQGERDKYSAPWAHFKSARHSKTVLSKKLGAGGILVYFSYLSNVLVDLFAGENVVPYFKDESDVKNALTRWETRTRFVFNTVFKIPYNYRVIGETILLLLETDFTWVYDRLVEYAALSGDEDISSYPPYWALFSDELPKKLREHRFYVGALNESEMIQKTIIMASKADLPWATYAMVQRYVDDKTQLEGGLEFWSHYYSTCKERPAVKFTENELRRFLAFSRHFNVTKADLPTEITIRKKELNWQYVEIYILSTLPRATTDLLFYDPGEDEPIRVTYIAELSIKGDIPAAMMRQMPITADEEKKIGKLLVELHEVYEIAKSFSAVKLLMEYKLISLREADMLYSSLPEDKTSKNEFTEEKKKKLNKSATEIAQEIIDKVTKKLPSRLTDEETSRLKLALDEFDKLAKSV